MEANFQRALALVLKHEGGWSDHPSDPGGATMKGVTLATYRAYINKNGTKDDLRNITQAQLEKVYREQYWNKVRGDDLPSGVDYAVFDFAVNSGPARAAKYLQAVVGVAQDGVIGPQTLAAVKAASASAVIDKLCDKRLAFLQGLKTWSTFGKGWGRRVADVRSAAKSMVQAPNSDAPKAKPASSSLWQSIITIILYIFDKLFRRAA